MDFVAEIYAALKGFLIRHKRVFLHCQIQLEHNFAFFIQVEKISLKNGIFSKKQDFPTRSTLWEFR